MAEMTGAPAPPRWSWSRVARRIRVPLGFLFAVFFFWRAKPTWLSLALGAIVAAIGLFIRAMASGQVKKNTELATTGPYAVVRNPLYLGSIIIAAGFTLAARDLWIALTVIALFLVIYVPVIRSEEVYLLAHFPAYAEYARRVPRLVPRTLDLRGVTTGFSAELYRQHREYNALLGGAGMLAALAIKILHSSGSL